MGQEALIDLTTVDELGFAEWLALPEDESGKLESLPGCEGLMLGLDALWGEIEPFESPDSEDGVDRP